jgi:hypothetical protein
MTLERYEHIQQQMRAEENAYHGCVPFTLLRAQRPASSCNLRGHNCPMQAGFRAAVAAALGS